VSRVGHICKVDTKSPDKFVYIDRDATSALGVCSQAVPYRAMAEIVTGGETKVFVVDNARKGDIIRAQKSTDNISTGACRVAKDTDAPYLKVGTALSSGRGLVSVSLDWAYMGSTSSYDTAQEFETVSKNLKSYPYVLTYGVDGIDTIVYDLGGGLSITKTFNYTLSVLTSIVLSGDTPAGIDLTKTLNYTGADLTGVTYS